MSVCAGGIIARDVGGGGEEPCGMVETFSGTLEPPQARNSEEGIETSNVNDSTSIHRASSEDARSTCFPQLNCPLHIPECLLYMYT